MFKKKHTILLLHILSCSHIQANTWESFKTWFFSLPVVSSLTTTQIISHNAQLSGKTQLIIDRGDITKKKVDAIVNAANKQLQAGGGVCGAIFNAAGRKELQKACYAFPILNKTDNTRCPVGQARTTPSFNLKKSVGISYIIHAVGPDCRELLDEKEQNKLLHNAYYNSLIEAEKHSLTSIAFPFISSAIYACPKQRAAHVALQAIKTYINQKPSTSLTKVYMVPFSDEDELTFKEQLKTITSQEN